MGDPIKAATVLGEVHSLLSRSAAWQSLPADRRERIASDMAKVSEYLAADPKWLDANRRATALEDKPPDPVEQLKGRLAQDPGAVGKGFTAGAVREGIEQYGELVKKVDFPAFVAGLVHGVFNAIVDASIKQMQAFSEMLAATAKTVDQFARDHVSDGQARDFIANGNPGAVSIDTTGEGGARLRPREDSDADVGAGFGMPGVDLSDEDSEQQLVGAAKLQMAQQRQQMLATMVLMGINRIVVTNGHINAKVVFEMRASDQAKRRAKAEMSDRRHEEHADTEAVGFALPFGVAGGSASYSENDHTAQVSSAVDDSSESRAAVKAQLTGDVRIAFKSETFPLERMVDVLGLQQLQAKAQPTPAPQPRGAAPAPPAASPAGAPR